jgi:hypothetical protein
MRKADGKITNWLLRRFADEKLKQSNKMGKDPLNLRCAQMLAFSRHPLQPIPTDEKNGTPDTADTLAIELDIEPVDPCGCTFGICLSLSDGAISAIPTH